MALDKLGVCSDITSWGTLKKSMNEEEEKFTGSSSYLEKSFLEELSFKIWSTKGTRFQADTRLTKKSKLSTISLAFLSHI